MRRHRKGQPRYCPRLSALSIASALLVLAGSASIRAVVLDWDEPDEIDETTTYYISIRAIDYQPFTNENYLLLTCPRNGFMDLTWHRGGRYSGGNTGYREWVYKFDALESERYSFGPEARWDVAFVEKLARHNILILKQRADDRTSRFDLSGVSKALAKGFRFQCLAEPVETNAPAPGTDEQGSSNDRAIGTAVVTASNADLRAKPDTWSEVIGKLAKGDIVVVLERRDSWIRVRAAKEPGYAWVHSGLVEMR